MSKTIDLTGQKFNRLTVIERAESTKSGISRWKCICECGNYCTVRTDNIRNGDVKSCGCLTSDTVKNRNTTHNKSKTRVYGIYRNMITRCYNRNNKTYRLYGARGITVCKEWLENFNRFYEWAVSNGYSEDLTIDRIDVNGNYEPNNCRWATHKTQSNNTRINRRYTYNGKTQTLKQWAEEFNVNYKTLWYRTTVRKWSIDKALTTL